MSIDITSAASAALKSAPPIAVAGASIVTYVPLVVQVLTGVYLIVQIVLAIHSHYLKVKRDRNPAVLADPSP